MDGEKWHRWHSTKSLEVEGKDGPGGVERDAGANGERNCRVGWCVVW